MRVARALLFGTMVGEALLNFTQLRNFWIVTASIIVGLLATRKIHSSEGAQIRHRFSRKTLVMCASILNALTIFRMTQSSNVFPRLTLLTLGGEDNAEWLGIASTAMFSDQNRTSFGLLYHVTLSALNGTQVLLSPLLGFDNSSISIPVNSVNAVYLLLLLLFPWLSLSLPLRRPTEGHRNGIGVAVLVVINLFTLGSLGEAYRIGHLTAAMTIFFTSLAIISLFSGGITSPTTTFTSMLFLSASLTLWHPLRPLAVLLVIVYALHHLASGRHTKVDLRLQSFIGKKEMLTANGVVCLSILVVGSSTVITGLTGVMAPIFRAMPYVQTFPVWRERRANYLNELIGAPGGTISVSSLFFLMLFAAATGTCFYVLFYVDRLKIYALVGLTLLGYLTFVLVADAVDDGVRSYGPTKMGWIFIPIMMCITLCWLLAHELGQKTERVLTTLVLSLGMTTIAVYAVEDSGSVEEFLEAPYRGLSETNGDQTSEYTRSIVRWELSPEIERLPVDGRTLGCIRLAKSGLVAGDFEAYNCGRRIYRVTLTALTPSQRLSTALMWRSLGRLSDSEMMGMIGRYTRPEDLEKQIVVLNAQSEYETTITLREFLNAALL